LQKKFIFSFFAIDQQGLTLFFSFLFFCLSTDTDSSRKLREDFAKTCFETLLQFSFVSKKSEEGAVSRVAVLSLLQRCQEVVRKYVEDERLSGKCPLPR
jgi:hypothetical protein